MTTTRYEDPAKMIADIQKASASGTEMFQDDDPAALLLGFQIGDERWTIRISKLRCASGKALLGIHKGLSKSSNPSWP